MSDQSWIRREVRAADHGLRLDVFLTKQPEVANRPFAKSLVQRGLVEIEDVRCKPGTPLEAGWVVGFLPEEEPPPPAVDRPEFHLRVLHEDSYLVVIDKPVGLAAHAAGKSLPGECFVTTLATARWGRLPTLSGEDRPGIVHRLDKDTSGVMALARTDEAFHFIQSQFKARTVQKEYRAICYGDPRFDSDHIEGNIATDPKRGDRMCIVPEGGREASTYYEVIERFGDLCYVRCRPRTGRTHQIRVHMASIGHPLVGDRLYRGRRNVRLPDGAPDPGRHCLHAWSLRLLHPRTHEEMLFDAPMPDDMTRLLRWLERRSE